MTDPYQDTPFDGEGLVIEARPAYDTPPAYRGLNGGGHPAPNAAVPARIAMALVKAARECGSAAKTGTGTEDRHGQEREFAFSTIDDVLEASSAALSAASLCVYPMCVHYDVVAREANYIKGLWADYSFQFMIVWADEEKGLSETWICPHDIRHISLPYEGGKTEGMAQSYALKHFLRGILRIKTGEKDAESARVPRGQPAQKEEPRPAPKQLAPEVMTASSEAAPIAAPADTKPRRGRPPAARFPFDFGRSADPGSNGFEEVTAEECLALFERIVKPLTPGKRKEWKEINRIGLEQLCGAAKPTWLQIMRVLEATG